ncbi:MAG TPA: energy transducer TonB, partial [Nevskiaceae bacterium]|nr:energy transducer TonB [Nevskiaceae bacterium]
ESALRRQRQLSSTEYRLRVLVWITAEGAIENVKLVGSTGKPEIDRLVRESMATAERMAQPPPKDMPQPVQLQITSS